MVLDKIERKCLIIDVAYPFDIRVKDKEKEKIENYQDLKPEVKRIWKLRKVTVVPIIIGSLGTVSKDIEKYVGRSSIGDGGSGAFLRNCAQTEPSPILLFHRLVCRLVCRLVQSRAGE